jgi:choice-of-anchor B domain-containing protein
MREVQFIPGPTSGYCYREIKTHKNFGYIVYDYPTGGEFIGMQIVDLSQLPDTVILVKTFLYADTSLGAVSTSHTLTYSDGYLYCNGSSHYAPGGTVIFSVKSDPVNPEFVGTYEPTYLHDTYVRNDTLYGAAIYSGGGLYIADVSDKANPVTLGKIVYAGSGTHNSWISVDGMYAFTADEIGTTHDLKVWAMDSLPNSAKVAEWSADPTTSIHNVYGRGQYLYASHYKAGARVLDVHDPTNPVEVGFYDTYQPPIDSVPGQYAGCWAVFPYFPSGRIIASDMQTGMYLFRFDSLKARSRVRLLEPQDSVPASGGFYFRWTSAAKQVDDPHYYELHLQGTGIDTVISTTDTTLMNQYSYWLEEGDYTWFVTVRDEFTEVSSVDTFQFHSYAPFGVTNEHGLAGSFKLLQNYPNPFNPRTKIDFSLARATSVSLKLYGILGEEVKTLLNGEALPPGNYSIAFNAQDLSSGVYFYKLVTPYFTESRKMIFGK